MGEQASAPSVCACIGSVLRVGTVLMPTVPCAPPPSYQMESMQRENEWKESWIAHEIQTFQQREQERNALKAGMNEERARWLLKLKEYTAELKEVRDENLTLKGEVSALKSKNMMHKVSTKHTRAHQRTPAHA